MLVFCNSYDEIALDYSQQWELVTSEYPLFCPVFAILLYSIAVIRKKNIKNKPPILRMIIPTGGFYIAAMNLTGRDDGKKRQSKTGKGSETGEKPRTGKKRSATKDIIKKGLRKRAGPPADRTGQIAGMGASKRLESGGSF
jgi:hypothetical protein